jgi:hypothetical protein
MRYLLAFALAAMVLLVPTAAGADELCSSTAVVSWQPNLTDLTVEGVYVDRVRMRGRGAGRDPVAHR